MNKGLAGGLPGNVKHDGQDIIKGDIPKLMKLFDDWYAQQSPVDADLSKELNRYISNGEMDTGLLIAWRYFKTSTTKGIRVRWDLDSHRLFVALFGQNGATASLFPDNVQREGYRNLFEGLYTLYRAPFAHNSDVQYDPAEAQAILSFINSMLVKIERAGQ